MTTLALQSSNAPTIASRSMSSESAATTACSSESSTSTIMSGASNSDSSDTSVEADNDNQQQQQDTLKFESRALFLSQQVSNSGALEVMSASPTTTSTSDAGADDDAGEESEEHSSRSSRDTIKRKAAKRENLDKDTFATPMPFVAPSSTRAGVKQGLGREHADLRESGQQRQKQNVVDHQHSTIQRYLSQLPVTNSSQYSYHYVQGQASRRGKPSSRPSSPNTFATPQSPSSGAVTSPTLVSSSAPYSSTGAAASTSATPVSSTGTARTRRPSLAASTSTSAAGGGPPASASFRRHALARSYTLNSVSTMLRSPSSPVLLSSNTSGSPPHTLLSTTVGSVAPPVHNSASVTFAPEPTATLANPNSSGNSSSNAAVFTAAVAGHGRPRSHSHSQSLSNSKVTSPLMSPHGAFDGASRPLSPAVASMAFAAATSLASPSSPSSSSSPPPSSSSRRKNSLLASASSTMNNNNTTSNSVGAVSGSRVSSTTTAITNAAPPPPPLLHSNTHHPYHHSPPDHGRRHSVDPSAYAYLGSDTSGANINHTTHNNTIIAPVLTSPSASSSSATSSASPPPGHSGTLAGHAIRSSQQQQQQHHHHPRRHHQSVSGAPLVHSQSQYSSLADSHNAGTSHTTTTDQLLQLSSRYRKASLGSQTLLSPSGSGLMHYSSSSSTATAANNGQSNSSSAVAGTSSESVMPASSWQSQWDGQHHRYSPSKDLGGGSGSVSNGSNAIPGQAGPQHHQSQQQHSPTRSRGDPYLSTSPRYSGRASHDSQRNNQLEAKIVLLGRQGVGKTSLVHRYITGQFSSSLPMTIGASFLVKKLDFEGGIKVRLQIWDTAGQERFRSMAPMYYRGAHAAILVYDITNDDSLADIRVWLDELRRNMSSDLIVHIVGNKADLAHSSRKITLEHARSQIAQWIAQPASAMDAGPSQTSSTLSVPPGRRSTSGGNGQSTSASARSGTEDTNTTSSRPSMATLASFSLSRSNSRQKPIEEQEALPAFKDWGIEEVSAKEDEGIDILFATIAGKLVERKHQIEQERTLRTKDSIMITDEMKGINAQDPTRVWGCC